MALTDGSFAVTILPVHGGVADGFSSRPPGASRPSRHTIARTSITSLGIGLLAAIFALAGVGQRQPLTRTSE